MDAQTTDRRLAALLFADVVDYSKRMGADEAGTLADLNAFQNEIFRPAVAGHRGRIVKSLGDGWLVEFSSAIAAVNCAMQVQDRLAVDEPLALRIGVHVGDVIDQEDDLYGDGVNVAARLEPLAEPGGVAISEMAFASLDGTMRPSFDDTGEHELKNIDRPMRIWMRRPTVVAAPQPDPEQAQKDAGGFPTLVVLPLTTSDARAEVHELADAVTNDLGLYFGSLGWLNFRTGEAPQPGAYCLKGQLRAGGDRLRLQVQLTGPDGASMWSGRLDGDLADSFDWQDQVSEDITSNVIGFIFDAEIARLDRIAPEDWTAEQCFLHGLLRRGSMTEDYFVEGLTDFSRALEKDPSLTEAYAEAIFFVMGGQTMGYKGKLEPFFDRHKNWMDQVRAQALSSPALDLCMATAAFFKNGDTHPLQAQISDALRRAPFDVKVLVFSGWGSLWSGDTQIAMDCFLKVERLSRFSPYESIAMGGLAVAQIQLGQDEAALAQADAGIRKFPDYTSNHYVRAAALAHLDREAEAIVAMAEAQRIAPKDSVTAWRAVNDYGGSATGQRYFDGMIKAGMPA